jgi:hypothetical protein
MACNCTARRSDVVSGVAVVRSVLGSVCRREIGLSVVVHRYSHSSRCLLERRIVVRGVFFFLRSTICRRAMEMCSKRRDNGCSLVSEHCKRRCEPVAMASREMAGRWRARCCCWPPRASPCIVAPPTLATTSIASWLHSTTHCYRSMPPPLPLLLLLLIRQTLATHCSRCESCRSLLLSCVVDKIFCVDSC